MATPAKPLPVRHPLNPSLPTDLEVSIHLGQSSDRPREAESDVRIAIVVSHPIQYFAPWYRALATTQGVIVRVFFCRNWGVEPYYDRDFNAQIRWDIPLLDGYDWEFLATRDKSDAYRFFAVDNPSISEALERYCPDMAMIHGYAHRTMWRTVRWCNRNRVPVVLISDSSAPAARALWKRVAKALVVRYFYAKLDGAFSTGDNNRDYHRQYGLPADRIFGGVLPIDCARLADSTGDPARARDEIREKHRIPTGAFTVIFSGKLIPLKCVLHLLEAIRRCEQGGLEIWCLVVGDGPERPRIEEFIREHTMRTVVMAGFVNQSSIGKYYAASDVVALMSTREAKGAPVPEAGIFGCPAILCDRVGCIGPTDSARPGENCLIYAWSDIDALTDCITRLCSDRLLYTSMSLAARSIAKAQDVTIAAEKLKDAGLRLRKLGNRSS